MTPEATLIGRIVAASTRHPLIPLLLALVLTGVALVYTAQNFALTADTSKLISTTLDWRKHELTFEKAFPQTENVTVVVIDAATPELAQYAADNAGRGIAGQGRNCSTACAGHRAARSSSATASCSCRCTTWRPPPSP